MYNRRGRVDGPHYAMSITKTLTSVTLARAIQLGLLSIDDLDQPIIDFMPEIDRSKIKPGVETITLRDALFMDTGKGDGYFYFFHNRSKLSGGDKIDFISGVGAGGQYMSTFPDLNIVLVATSHNKGNINAPLQAAIDHLIPLFTK